MHMAHAMHIYAARNALKKGMGTIETPHSVIIRVSCGVVLCAMFCFSSRRSALCLALRLGRVCFVFHCNCIQNSA